MSLLRFDPTTNDWVVSAPSRALRPHAGVTKPESAAAEPSAGCPFCPGNENLTPPEIRSVRADAANAKSWLVRVVPNKFPALRIEDDARRAEEGRSFRSMGGCGAHEVVVESPDHESAFARQPVEQVERVLLCLQERYRDLMRDERFQTAIVFKNHGRAAGTSLAHPHWQVIATPVVPRMLRVKNVEAMEYYDREGVSLYTVLLNDELAAGKRVLTADDDFVAIMPYASHCAFETWIMPRRPQASFALVGPAAMKSLAATLKRVLLKLHTGLDNPDFNLTIDSAPRGEEDEPYFVWHIRIVPRLATAAGFELGSGMSINTVLPEDACAFLSEAPISNGAGS
jgi:UDPglucose--hexose-1-phosphate uridylyltransferase